MIYFLGIDVSKSTLDLALLGNGIVISELKIPNERGSLKSFLKGIKQSMNLTFDQLVVCMEHTGIYNYPALEVFHKSKIKVCLEPALQIKQSQGMTRGKSDQVDAKRIAVYAYKNQDQLAFWQPQRVAFQHLKGLLSLRERLVKTKTKLEVPLQESVGYLEPAIVKSMKTSTEPILKAITKQLKKVEAQMLELVKEDIAIKTQFDHATSVPGIGKITALNMIISTNGFERISEAKQFACYAGVAPFTHQSGTSIRGRTRVSKLANMTMKRLLHLAAMAAIQSSDELKQFYERKVATGKNKMSVLNAVRNKLISRVFACVKEQRNYKKIYQHALA